MVAMVGLVSRTARAQSQSDSTLSTRPFRHCHQQRVSAAARLEGEAGPRSTHDESEQLRGEAVQRFMAGCVENDDDRQQDDGVEQAKEACTQPAGGVTRPCGCTSSTRHAAPKNNAMLTVCSSGMSFRIIVVYTA